MPKSAHSGREVIKHLANENRVQKTSPEEAREILNIILDAVNCTVGGLIITTYTEGTIAFANPSFCKMFDYLREDIVGKNAAELFSTKEIRYFSDVVAVIDISKDDTEEFIVEKSDGSTFVVEVSASNVTGSSGQVVGRMASFVDITKRKKLELAREKLIEKQQTEIKILKGIIPICTACKKVRDGVGFWHQVENYIKKHSEADFSHSICPDCAKKLYPDFRK